MAEDTTATDDTAEDDTAEDDTATDDTATDDTATDDTATDDTAEDTTAADATATDTEGKDLEFVEFIVKAIVDNPDEVEIERTVDEMGVLLTLKVNKEDMGKLIGKNGQTAKSIRTLLRIIGSKNNARVNLKIVEPEEA